MFLGGWRGDYNGKRKEATTIEGGTETNVQSVHVMDSVPGAKVSRRAEGKACDEWESMVPPLSSTEHVSRERKRTEKGRRGGWVEEEGGEYGYELTRMGSTILRRMKGR